jgi:hypothetical protein
LDDQIKKNVLGGACGTDRDLRGTYRALVGRPEGNKLFGKPRLRWEGNIKMYLQEMG